MVVLVLLVAVYFFYREYRYDNYRNKQEENALFDEILQEILFKPLERRGCLCYNSSVNLYLYTRISLY